MSVYRKFKTNEQVETEGTWINYGVCKIKVARAGGSNKKFLKALDKIRSKYQHQIEFEIMDNDMAIELMREVYADSIVLDWQGVTDENDQPMPCTRENIIKLFTDLPDLFLDVQKMASSMKVFKEKIDEEEAKN